VADNPDILNMQDVPSAIHSRKIRDLCNRFNMADPFRILYPEKVDFSYTPWGNLRDNRSRIDFFLILKSISEIINDCYIKPSVQSKLFDHKAITVSFLKKVPISSRPNISNCVLRDPDIEVIVKLACYECYAQHLIDAAIKIRALNLIGRGFNLMRRAGPDPTHIEYVYAELMDVDVRSLLMVELRDTLLQLDEINLQELEVNIEADIFMDYLMNNIRNEVISYQSFISKTVESSTKKLTLRLLDLKRNLKQILMRLVS
jgi:hypothetical protein